MSQSDDIWQWGILFLRKRIDMVYLSSFHFPSAERESEHFDMVSSPVSTTKWTDIPSVRTYHDFFEAHAGEFRKG